MKRIMFIIISIMSLAIYFGGAYAEIDLSDMTMEEMIALQEQLNNAINDAKSDVDDNVNDGTHELDTNGYIELAKGSKGEEVKALQTRLFDLGYYSISIDGDYGNGTVRAINEFQAFNGMEQTGVASPELQAFLFSENAIAKPIPVSSISIEEKNPMALVGSTMNIAEMVIMRQFLVLP